MKQVLLPALGVLALASIAPAQVRDKQVLTLAGARTAVQAIAAQRSGGLEVAPLQSYF